MAYYIDIIDTTSPLTKLVLEDASAAGIVLKWNGGDSKDEMAIVSSEFNFDMLTKTADDAAFIEFFSGDEHRFKVQVKNDADDSIIWQGYILPDLYSEPYKNACFFVSFTATDGLGRLKGKYLPDEYYSREKSLIDIFCQCLKLTGIELDLYFNPAIENFVNKDWNTIYIDTATFLDKDKKQDAYRIFETLLKDTLCLCYQADNRWYIEGINTRQIRKVTYRIYNTSGVKTGEVAYSRLLKMPTALVTPMVTVTPPYNEITITHKKTETSLPKTLSKEQNDGWAMVTGVNGSIHSSAWMGNGGILPMTIAKSSSGNTEIKSKGSLPVNDPATFYDQDNTQFFSLKEKVYVYAGQKVNFKFKFQINKFSFTFSQVPNPDNMDLWKNPFKYEIVLNGTVLFSNFNGQVLYYEDLVFESNGSAALDLQYVFVEEGLLDIRIYQPFGKLNSNKIGSISVLEAEMNDLDYKDEEIQTNLINGDFTVDKELELTYADDKSCVSLGFRLNKLKEQTVFYNDIVAPVLYGLPFNGKNYSVVSLASANLIKENPFNVYRDGFLIPINNVIYNFKNGEEMVIETTVLYNSGSFVVRKYAVDDLIENRSYWTQWSDAIYKIEKNTYATTVANIYRRMFNVVSKKLDLTALNAIKFNDIVLFNYVYQKDFVVLNCSWNLDQNKTTLTLGRSIYTDVDSTTPGDENIPPIVLAGEDIYLTELQNTVALSATAYDPDGTIISQQWTKINGAFGDIIESPFNLQTNLQNLTEDYYTYQIAVIDNGGATAVDAINVIRMKNYNVSLDLFLNSDVVFGPFKVKNRKYKLNVSPVLLPNTVVTFSGLIRLQATEASETARAYYVIFKNGVEIEKINLLTNIYNNWQSQVLDTNITINFIAGDEIFIELYTGGFATSTTLAKLNLTNSTVTPISSIINGLPIIIEQTHV